MGSVRRESRWSSWSFTRWRFVLLKSAISHSQRVLRLLVGYTASVKRISKFCQIRANLSQRTEQTAPDRRASSLYEGGQDDESPAQPRASVLGGDLSAELQGSA